MGPGLNQFESDPLFSAAEVVQDSADRMDSIFRLLLHELSLFQDGNPDPKLLASIDCYRRDLATTLETSKWQLEDFERAVNLSALSNKQRMREDVISIYEQFVMAIREQINRVEKNLEDALVGYPISNADYVNLNEQDRDGLALFLSGGDPVEQSDQHNSENNILRRFLDPTTASTSKDSTHEVVEHKSRETENLNVNVIMNGAVHTNRSFDGTLRKVGSHCSARLGLEALGSHQEASSDRQGEDGSWDLEANRAKPKNFSDENKPRRHNSRTNLFGFFNNIWSAYGSRVARTYTKVLKDREERRHLPSYTGITQAGAQQSGLTLASGNRSFYGLCYGFLRKIMQQIQTYRARYQRSPYYILANNRHSIILTLAILCTLIILGILVKYIT